MNEPNHSAPDRDRSRSCSARSRRRSSSLVIAPTLPPGNGHRRGVRAGQRQHRPVRDRHADRGDDRRLLRLQRCSSSAAVTTGPQEGVAIHGDSRVHLSWLAVTIDHRPLPGDLRHGRAVRRRLGRRPGPGPRLQAVGQTQLPVQVIAPAVGVHLPLPDLRRDRDRPSRAAGRAEGRTTRHLARRDPLVLGAEARGQGRRQPRRRQRRLRRARGERQLRTSAAASSAASGTATCSTPGRW